MQKGNTMNQKKLAAAIAAVFAHIKTQEEAAVYAMAPPVQPEPAMPAAEPQMNFPKPNAWGVAGRQAQMQLRSMMQLRMFK